MEHFELNFLKILFAFFIYVIIRLATRVVVNKVGAKFQYHKARMKIAKKILNIIYFILLAGIVLFIWGVDQSKFLYFLTTLLTVLGVAFFAQWSIISNITSSLIIFFNHPIKIGETISILDKEYHIQGKIHDIGIFFMTIRTRDNEFITIPSNVIMQKMVKRHKGIWTFGGDSEGSSNLYK